MRHQKIIRSTFVLAIVGFLTGMAPNVGAVPVTPGLTFTVASDAPEPGTLGVHFHPFAFGEPFASGFAEVGGFAGIEEVRGLSEFDLSAVMAAASAFVSFDVSSILGASGLPEDEGGIIFPFDIRILSYPADNMVTLDDYESGVEFVADFSTADLNVGDSLRFDVTSLLDAALFNDNIAFGLMLQQLTSDRAGPLTSFNNFQLTTIPEPAPFALLALGLPIVLMAGRASRPRPLRIIGYREDG